MSSPTRQTVWKVTDNEGRTLLSLSVTPCGASLRLHHPDTGKAVIEILAESETGDAPATGRGSIALSSVQGKDPSIHLSADHDGGMITIDEPVKQQNIVILSGYSEEGGALRLFSGDHNTVTRLGPDIDR